jgi:antitoxin ParD1/3/4
MNITLDADWEQYVRKQIDAGKYPSADGVVHEALRIMREREQSIDELRRAIAVGIDQADQGLAVEFDDAALARIKTKACERV